MEIPVRTLVTETYDYNYALALREAETEGRIEFGSIFMQYFYMIFDMEEMKMGFAPLKDTNSGGVLKTAPVSGTTPTCDYSDTSCNAAYDPSAITVPDAPTNLADDTSITSSSDIGLIWDAPVSDGGSAVIDYKLVFDDGNGYALLANALTALTYTASGLTTGTEYKFKI